MAIYDIVVPKDNMLRQINELVDFTFILEELKSKYCLDNGRNAVPPIRMFKYLLLKSIFELSDVDVVERSKYDMSFKYFLDMAPAEIQYDVNSDVLTITGTNFDALGNDGEDISSRIDLRHFYWKFDQGSSIGLGVPTIQEMKNYRPHMDCPSS